MRRTPAALVALAIAGALQAHTSAVDALQPTAEALVIFDRYVQLTDRRDATGSRFLWIDGLPERERDRRYRDLKSGEIFVQAEKPAEDLRPPDATIHHWIATSLVPGVPLTRVLSILQDYDRYAQQYTPVVSRSKLLARDGNRFDVELRVMNSQLGVTVVLDIAYRHQFEHLDATRVRTSSVSTSIHEVRNAGRADERRIPSDQGTGYLWKHVSRCAFEQRAEGTYHQCEYLALSRRPPRMLAWILGPITNRVSRGALEFSLQRTREIALRSESFR